jgi:DNA-binding transcriptional MocR family regulator
VVEDDPYGELYFDAPPPPSMLALSSGVPGSRDWLAHCGSFSKILSPGLRVGWMIAPPELLAKATMCKQFSDAHTSNLTQAICAHYLTQDRLNGALAVVRSTYAERARVMAESLRRELGDAIEFNQPQGGMFFWARLTGANGKAANAAEFAKRAIDQGVAFVPGAPFYAHDPDLSTLRLSFATADVSKIEEGIARLGRAL